MLTPQQDDTSRGPLTSVGSDWVNDGLSMTGIGRSWQRARHWYRWTVHPSSVRLVTLMTAGAAGRLPTPLPQQVHTATERCRHSDTRSSPSTHAAHVMPSGATGAR